MLTALASFAQSYSYETYSTSGVDSGSGIGFSPVLLVVYLFAWVVYGFLLSKIFEKAKVAPKWAAYVPIYNSIKMLEMVGRPWWWLLLFLIPFAGLIFAIIAIHDLSKSFGHGAGYTVMFIFIPIVPYLLLAFGDDQYQGPAALNKDGGTPPAAPASPSGPITPAV